MATLPSASTTVSSTAGAPSTGDDLITVIGCVPTSADAVPRVFGNAAAIYAQHGYSEALEYAALHIAETRKPVLFVGVPIVTAGVVGRKDTSGHTGDGSVDVTAGGSGVLHEHDGAVRVVKGGLTGTDQITLEYSYDGGLTWVRARLGTAVSLALPLIGVTFSCSSGKTLVAGDTVITWHGTGPLWNAAGLVLARTALGAQQKASRSWIVIGDAQVVGDATAIVTSVNAYETAHDRFVYARASVRDFAPAATLGTTLVSAAATCTFAEVGATGDTITRSSGSFVSDGFALGDLIDVTGATEGGNNITAAAGLAGVAALVLTLDDDDLVAEGPTAGVTIVGHESLTFATGAKTITRSRGSWLDDGFRDGDLVTLTGTSGATNDLTAYAVTTVTAKVLTFPAVAADEVIRADAVVCTVGQTKSAWIADVDAAFATIDAQKRVDLAAGRARKVSTFSGWNYRRPASWAASVREYQHDLHVTTWRKADGPLDGWDLLDADGNLYEFDEAVDGGALAARFTCFRSWSNGPRGTFVAMSLTRQAESDPLAYTHNMAVTNAACAVNQAVTENFIGGTPVLDAEGHATRDELQSLKGRVDRALQLALLQDLKGEGPRASNAYWTPATDDVLNVPNATLNGVLTLNLRGTIVNVATTVKVS